MIVADFGPRLVGANVIKNFWLAPGAIEPVAGETVNCVLVDVMEVIDSVPVPVFVTVTLSILLDPTFTSRRESTSGATENAGMPIPVPPTGTLDGEPAPLCVKTMFPALAPALVGAKVM